MVEAPTHTPSALGEACIFLALSAGAACGVLHIRASRSRLTIPFATLTMALLVTLMFFVQLSAPGLLMALERNSSLLQHGEAWRAVTALFVQDGWVAGAIFNVAILLSVGAVTEQNLGVRRWLAVYLGGGVLTEFLSLAWEPEGAGNSIAVFALAGAMVALPRSRVTAADICVRLLATAAGVGLLIVRDNHGIGFAAGVAIAAGLAIRDRMLATATN